MIRNIAVIFLLSYISAYSQLVEPKATVQQSEFDFGNINQNDVVEHSFIITNTGGDLLKVSDFRASCGCTAARPEKTELKPGESTKLKVSFNSKGRKGPQLKTINFKTNDPDKPVVTLTIRGNIIVKENADKKSGAQIFFPETRHDFGRVKEGSVLNYTFSFQNNGTAPLIIKDVKTSCGCTAAVIDKKNLQPGQSGLIKVDLDTKKRQGKMSKTITIVSNDTIEPNKVITVFADVVRN